jgi:hypothetical protein
MNKKYLLAALIGAAALSTFVYNKQSAASTKQAWLSSQYVRHYDKVPYATERYNITKAESRLHSVNSRYVFQTDNDEVRIDRRGSTFKEFNDAIETSWIEVRRYRLLNAEAFPGIGDSIQVDIHLKPGMTVERVQSPDEPE